MSNAATADHGVDANARPDDIPDAPRSLGVAGHRPVRAAAGQNAVVTLIVRALDLVWEWRERARGRRQLAVLPDHLLKDMGLTSLDAERESSKPFWIG